MGDWQMRVCRSIDCSICPALAMKSRRLPGSFKLKVKQNGSRLALLRSGCSTTVRFQGPPTSLLAND